MPSYRIALAGNPNVGKSTLFNALTGARQHTGNWAGKTVALAEGALTAEDTHLSLIDLPGTCSLHPASPEEAVTRDLLQSGGYDAVIVVCDACALARSLTLALQVTALSPRVIVCINLLDEAAARGITVACDRLEAALGLPVVGVTARTGVGLDTLLHRTLRLIRHDPPPVPSVYGEVLESRLFILSRLLGGLHPAPRYAALCLLAGESLPLPDAPPHVAAHIRELREDLQRMGIGAQEVQDLAAQAVQQRADALAAACTQLPPSPDAADRRRDRILLGRAGIPLMLALLALLLWITIAGADPLTGALTVLFTCVGDHLRRLLTGILPPQGLSLLCDGIYGTLTWVIAVMLPPMAIFFPLFTLLEDAGLLPRIAYKLDHSFRRAGTCGKQALTMCMGLGCNACGVTGCRIIDSPRERRIAVLTNALTPCNGRFPILITLSVLFLGGRRLSVLTMLLCLLVSLGMTLAMSALLSRTLLRGIPSAYVLEMPPYRRPQLLRILVRSLLDRTVRILGRACLAAAPAGLVIWLLANLRLGDGTVLTRCAGTLDPIGQFFGMDGMILLAFLLGFPASEIVIPILIMGYLSAGTLTELSLPALHTLLLDNGWTPVTAVCVMIFTLFHFPCATTFLTICKESGIRTALLAMVLPTAAGLLLCACISHIGAVFL